MKQENESESESESENHNLEPRAWTAPHYLTEKTDSQP